MVDPVVSRPFTEQLVLRPFMPAITYQIAILFPINEELSQIARVFVDALRKQLSR